jgi:small subunit ribosomal protein S13
LARIAGIDIPDEKQAWVALQYIRGIGRTSSMKILNTAGVIPATKMKDIKEAELARIRELIDKGYTVEGDLKKEVSLDIKRLIEIGSYRGTRHRRSLPVHGQRTRTNARTRKGPRHTVAGRGKRRGVAK